ncbi:MAG: alpha/beta fold hydrolase [Bacteroidia bacterium]
MRTTGENIEIRTGDITVRYNDLGEGSIPVIFIHGFPFDKTMWQPQTEALKNNNRVISYDIRGFGKTSAGKEKPSIQLFADDLIKFMDVLQIKKAIVCGLSMGGYILLNAVNRYPERFEGIILCDTQCIADSPEVKEKRKKTIAQIEKDGLSEYADNFVKTIFTEESINSNKTVVDKIKQTILATAPVTITQTLHALANRQESCFALTEIRIPTLIICGRQDIVTPVSQSEYLYEHISHSEMHTIDKASHMSNLEQPEEFNKYVSAFAAMLQPAILTPLA